MADTKITALTAIGANPIIPSTFPIPMVDLTDTSMAASGTTKKVTVNQILGAGGTATLASATVNGALTAGGNVGFGTTNLTSISGYNTLKINNATNGAIIDLAQADSYKGRIVGSTGGLQFETSGSLPIILASGGVSQYRIGTLGVFDWYDGAGGTRMTLNSTGLGVGTSPAEKLTVAGKIRSVSSTFGLSDVIAETTAVTGTGYARLIVKTADREWRLINDASTSGSPFIIYDATAAANRLLIDSSGNVGIGVTPSAWAGIVGIQSAYGALSGNTNINIVRNSYYNGGWKYTANGRATQYQQDVASHIWYYDTGTQVAGTACNFTAAMTLDASGRLLVGTTAVPNVGAATTSSGFSINGSGDAAYIACKIDNGTCGYFRRDGTDGAVLNFYKANSAVGNISVTASACTFNSTSDYRLKESVQPLTGGLARVSALKPSIYKWKADGSNGEGFIAHELAEVVPAAVSGEKDAVNEDGSIKPQGVDMSRVVPILVAAIQELAAEVNALKNA